jgi:hypothetical protein
MQENFDDFGKPVEAVIPPSQNPPAPSPSPAQPEQARKVSKIAAALAKAQGQIPAPPKTKTVDYQPEKGPRVYYKYADLADVIAAYKAALSQNEIMVTHRLNYGSKGYGMTTEIVHSSGEFLATWYPLPDPANRETRPQAFGSALTYARRYSISALLGIASDEDDDGASAPPRKPSEGSNRTPSPGQAAPRPQGTQRQAPAGPSQGSVLPAAGGPGTATQVPPDNKAQKLVTEPQLTRLFTIAGKTGWTNEFIHEYVATRWKLESTKELTMRRYDALVAVVQKKTPQQAYATILQEPQV